MAIGSRGRARFLLAGAIAAGLVWVGIAASAAEQLPPGGGPIPPLRRGADGKIEVVPPSARTPPAATSPNASARPATPQPHAAPPDPAPKPTQPVPTADSTATARTAKSADRLSPANGAYFAPRTVQPSRTGDIVGVRVENTGATAEKSGYVTFGQVFLTGAVQPSDTLVARIDGTDGVVQMDAKATNADGSVRHAVLTLRAPALAAGGALDLMLAKGAAAAPSPAAPAAAALLASGYDTIVNFTFHGPDGTATADRASAAAALKAALSSGTVQRWLAGPQVNEYVVVTTVGGGKLKVEFDIRAYADGATTTDVIFDNSWMFSPGKSDVIYDLSINQGGRQVYSASRVGHYLYSMWHHEVDSPGTISPNVQFDVAYLLTAGALPAYDPAPGVSAAAIQKSYERLDATNTGPLGTAEVTTYMPTTGARADIAPQPGWVVRWLLSQNVVARMVMMANADASGGIPWHYTDESTGKPINGQNYPKFHAEPSRRAPEFLVPTNGWPTYRKNGDPWTPDTAHTPDLNYVPYLITGGHYRLRLLQAAGDFAITGATPRYSWQEKDATGSVYLGLSAPHGQVRGTAWSLRNLAEAAYITPDNDPLKDYFLSAVGITMNGFIQQYITNGNRSPTAAYGRLQGFMLDGNTEGYAHPGQLPQPQRTVLPWMQNFLVTTFAEIASMNIPKISDQAIQMLRYMNNFIAGLYTNDANGYNPLNGPAYTLFLNDPVTGKPYATWADFQQGNVASHDAAHSVGLAEANPTNPRQVMATDLLGGFLITARAALAEEIAYTQSPQAMQAYSNVNSQIATVWNTSRESLTSGWQTSPQWNVMPHRPRPPN